MLYLKTTIVINQNIFVSIYVHGMLRTPPDDRWTERHWMDTLGRHPDMKWIPLYPS